MTSYIPRQEKLTRERIEAKLEVCLIQKLESYCEYLDSDRDYVIAQALEIAFKKDKGFAEWLSSREESGGVQEPAHQGAPQGRRKPRAAARISQGEDITTSWRKKRFHGKTFSRRGWELVRRHAKRPTGITGGPWNSWQSVVSQRQE